MLVAVRRDLPDVSLQVPDGGYYLWLSFPADVDCDALARAASATGVTVLAGSKFFARTDMGHPRNHMRVAYSHATPEEIDDGIGRLAEAYRAMMSSAAGTAR
jgi:2-aminoadipate transaminase